MQNHPSNDNYEQMLSFSPSVRGVDAGIGDDSVLKTKVMRLFSKSLRRIRPSSRTADREFIAAEPLAEPRVVSRYHVDTYGRPRILSKWEITLHALAWPVVVAVACSFGLAIFVLAAHNSSTLKPQESASQSLVESQEAAP